MKTANLYKSCPCEIVQWVNAIFSGRGKAAGRKWPARGRRPGSATENHSGKRKNATLGDFTLRTEMLHPSALRVHVPRVPLPPDNPSLQSSRW